MLLTRAYSPPRVSNRKGEERLVCQFVDIGQSSIKSERKKKILSWELDKENLFDPVGTSDNVKKQDCFC